MESVLKLAFIAKYAPPVGSTEPVPTDRENKAYSKYHFDIWNILKDRFPNLTTGTDANYIMEHHNDIEYIFSLFNRAPFRNSEIFVSSLAEYYGIPYLGARPNIRALAEDKHLAKIMSRHCGIDTPRWVAINVGENMPETEPFPGPFFVKPRYGASSKFIDEKSLCRQWSDVIQQANYLFKESEDIIIEEFIDGIHYSSPVIFQNGVARVLPPVREESTHPGNIITYHQKRKVEGGLLRTVETSPERKKQIEATSNLIAHFVRPIDYTRIDYILGANEKLQFLEFNVCCNLGEQSAFTLSAGAVGLTHAELVSVILTESLKRQNLF